MNDEIFMTMVPTGERCDCAEKTQNVLAGCTSKSLTTALRSWDELVALLAEHPHMEVKRVNLYQNRPKPEFCPLCGENTVNHSFKDRKTGWCEKCDRQFCAGCWAEHDRKDHSK